MKQTVLTLAAVLVAVTAFAQGTFNPANRVTGVYDAPVTGHNGQLASGTAYLAQWLAGPAGGTRAAVGQPLAFRTGTGAGYLVSAASDPTAGIVPSVPGGSPADIQLVAWDASLGSTWAAAEAAGLDGIGRSGVITVTLGGGGVPPAPAANLVGLTGFTVAPVVPEPAIAALGLLGAGLLMIRRKK
jgi:hypothetical protein